MASSDEKASADVKKHAITVLGQQLDAIRREGFHIYDYRGTEENTGAVQVARDLVAAIERLVGGGDGE